MAARRLGLVLVLAVCFALTSWQREARAASSVQWDAIMAYSTLYDEGGNPLSTDGLVIQLVMDVDGLTDYSQMLAGYVGIGDGSDFGGASSVHSSAADDVVAASSVWDWYAASSGFWRDTVNSDVMPDENTDFYFRWFNNTTVGSSTEAGIIYNTTDWISPPDTGSAALADLTYGGSNSQSPNVLGSDYSSAGWQSLTPVPEPGTMGLFALGMMALAARRRFKKK